MDKEYREFIGKVDERDIDLLILEELHINHGFADWFAARVFDCPKYKSLIGAWHSLANEHGESDVAFVFTSDDGTTTAILIENKIDAKAQPDQGDRYRKRGDKGVADGDWQEFRTCLIAPRKYLQSPAQKEKYDCQIAYEEIMAFFVSARSTDQRHVYRARFIMAGVEKQRRGYQQRPPNDVMTAFVSAYWKEANTRFPDLRMAEPKPRAAGNTWVKFSPASIQQPAELYHQLTSGFVKLFFAGLASKIVEIEERYKDLASLIPDLEVQLAGKSVAISVPVEPLSPLDQSFDTCRDRAIAAMEIAQRLATEVAKRGFPK